MNDIFLTYASWIALEIGLLFLILGLITEHKKIELLENNIFHSCLISLYATFLKYYLFIFIFILIAILLITCLISTSIFFELFPEIQQAPNIVTALVGIFGIFFGSIGLHKIFLEKQEYDIRLRRECINQIDIESENSIQYNLDNKK